MSAFIPTRAVVESDYVARIVGSDDSYMVKAEEEFVVKAYVPEFHQYRVTTGDGHEVWINDADVVAIEHNFYF